MLKKKMVEIFALFFTLMKKYFKYDSVFWLEIAVWLEIHIFKKSYFIKSLKKSGINVEFATCVFNIYRDRVFSPLAY